MTEYGCPEASILAAFAEGSLHGEERAAVERHVANCVECPVVLGEVTRFLQTPAAERARSRYRWWIVAAVLAALCIPLAFWTRDPIARVRRIAASMHTRSYEGRLHDFPHARFDRSRGHAAAAGISIALKAEAERLARRDADADVLHARGVTALLQNNPREAVRLLTLAAKASPRDAAMWNDLAAALIARAALEDHAPARASAEGAFATANEALALDPTSPTARFNRAAALDLLGRPSMDAWRNALANEPSDEWRTEIRDRLGRVEDPN